jgi:hypothetical protein
VPSVGKDLDEQDLMEFNLGKKIWIQIIEFF